MYICMCADKTESDIKECISMGCNTFEELSEATQIGMGCGSCINMVYAILNDDSVIS